MTSIELAIVQINVVDLDAAWEFYVNVLGLRPKDGRLHNKPFQLSVPGAPAVVIYPASSRVSVDYPHATGSVLVFGTDDLSETISQWQAKNVEFIPIEGSVHPLGIGESPVGPYIAFRDPSGNVHELVQTRPPA